MKRRKIYTRTGDGGETGLAGGARTPKDSARIEALGAVDELNAALGWVKALSQAPALRKMAVPREIALFLEETQRELFRLGALLGTASVKTAREESKRAFSGYCLRLERSIDGWEARLPELNSFLVPGGGPLSAGLQMARAIARRSERALVAWNHEEGGGEFMIPYMNRLSDALFVLGRFALERFEGNAAGAQGRKTAFNQKRRKK
jgi:cob(I)alamin adenosyltransferase